MMYSTYLIAHNQYYRRVLCTGAIMKVKVSTLRRIIREEYTRIIREATLSRPDEGAPDSEWEKYFRSKCEVDAASMPERMRKSTIDSCVTTCSDR